MSNEDLREMLREQERALRFQLRGLENEDEKSLRMIQLSIAALAGGVAFSTVLLRTPDTVPSLSIVPIGIAAGLNLAALVLFIDAYIGFRDLSDAYVGPTPSWVADKLQVESWNLSKHLIAQIETNPLFFEHNLAVGQQAVKKRRRGIHVLLAALGTYAGGYIYILAKVVWT